MKLLTFQFWADWQVEATKLKGSGFEYSPFQFFYGLTDNLKILLHTHTTHINPGLLNQLRQKLFDPIFISWETRLEPLFLELGWKQRRLHDSSYWFISAGLSSPCQLEKSKLIGCFLIESLWANTQPITLSDNFFYCLG